jgi:DHA3 family macrolide efflux protein-like MFS transporter
MLWFFVTPARKAPASSGGYFTELRLGLSYIASSNYLRAFFLFYAILMFVFAAPAFLSPLQVARTFGAEPFRMRDIEVAFSAGMIIGGIAMSAWGGWKNRITTLGVAALVTGVGMVSLAITIPYWFYIGLMALIGLVLPMYNTAFNTFLQENVEPIYMGRVFGVVMMIGSAVMPMGMLLVGPLSDTVDIRWIMLASGILVLLVTILFMQNKALKKYGEKV